MTNESDPVVKELKLFIRGGVDGDNFLVQFPLVSRLRPFPDILFASKVKDLNNFVFELPNDVCCVTSKTYSYQSYAVGIIRGDQVHLSPLSDIYQARPVVDVPECDAIPIEKGINIDKTKFLSSSGADISSQMSVSVYKDNIVRKGIITCNDNSLNLEIEKLLPKLKEGPLKLKEYNEDLVNELLKYTHIIQGFFILKSEHSPERIKDKNDILAWDFICVCFGREKTIPMKVFNAFVDLFKSRNSDFSIKRILQGFARRNEKCVFLIKEKNEAFIKSNSSVIEKSNKYLEKLKNGILSNDEELGKLLLEVIKGE